MSENEFRALFPAERIAEAARALDATWPLNRIEIEHAGLRLVASVAREGERWVLDERGGLPPVENHGFALEDEEGDVLDVHEQQQAISDHLRASLDSG